jgi:hypothetical protein
MASSSKAKQALAAAIDAVLVLAAAAHETFSWEHWRVYAAALAAQLVLSTVCTCVRVRVHDGKLPPARAAVGLLTVFDIILTLPALSVAAAAGGAPIDAAVTWAALLAIGAGVMSERSGQLTRAIRPKPDCAMSRSACTQRRLPRRAAASPPFAPGSYSTSAGAAGRSRRSTGTGSKCVVARATPQATAGSSCATAA